MENDSGISDSAPRHCGVSKWNNLRDLGAGEAGAGQFDAARAAIEATLADWPQRRAGGGGAVRGAREGVSRK